MPLGQHTFDKLAHGRCFSMDSVLIHTVYFLFGFVFVFFFGGGAKETRSFEGNQYMSHEYTNVFVNTVEREHT